MAGFAEIVSRLSDLDSYLTLSVNSLSCPVSDFVWKTFSLVKVWIPLYLVVLFFLFRRLGWKRGLACLLALVLTVVACDQFANLVKDTVARLRPCHNPFMVENGLRILESKGGQYGFFSGHAANAMGFAVASSMLFRMDKSHRYGLYSCLIVLWAVLLGLSRVFVGKHYLGDVLVGFAAGSAIAFLISLIAVKICRKLFSLR